jgi:hypothetical protein
MNVREKGDSNGIQRIGEALAPMHPLLHAWSEHGDAVGSFETVDIRTLERWRLLAQAHDGIARPTFRAQDAGLLADGLHYEERIAECDLLATRERNPHDLFNALVWLRHPRLKRALNARQVVDIGQVGPKQRTRGQCALTHFDEAGAIVWLADADLLRLWDAHDWPALFLGQRNAWGSRIAVTVFGHALVEHVWNGNALPVAKALVAQVPASALENRHADESAIVRSWPTIEARIARGIETGEVLADPQDLRPLPLAGIPGWHADNTTEAFFRDAPCFRPLRNGRRYPAPLTVRRPAFAPIRVETSTPAPRAGNFPRTLR